MKKSKTYIFRAGAEGRARRRDVHSGVTEERRAGCVDIIDGSNVIFKKV